ncbi:hypothetical protein ACIBSW_10560 [Actinoplanes sp. NPDC049668]|uniref:hypothetical protein n=1 Tax=unclassified Actinoplanes TaxID=2626549 RepID=UPI0033A5F415
MEAINVDIRDEILADVLNEIEAPAPRRGPARRALTALVTTAVATTALVGASLVTGMNPAYAGTCGQPDARAEDQFYSCRVGAGRHDYFYDYQRRTYSSSPYPHYCYVFWVTVKAPCAFGQFEQTKCA